MQRALTCALLGFAALSLAATPQRAAAQQIELGGRAYVDYYYALSSPDDEREGLHGFTYRRLYVTSDFTLSDEFFGRARLEANEGSTGQRGPEPFVKDLWIAWRYWDEHEVRLGVMPPPAFETTEDVWGFRSLEQTILDFQDVNSSRDFGLRFDGPVGSDFRYAFMIANNNGVSPETNSYKRGYVQIEYYPTEHLVFTVGADRAGYEAPQESGTRFSTFGGYRSDGFAGGLELYWYETGSAAGDNFQNRGASAFSRVALARSWELVGRIDVVSEGADEDIDERFLLVGAAYSPLDGVRIIPNLWVFDTTLEDDPEALARMTVEVRF